MPRALVALGANLGDRRQSLARALDALRAHEQITGVRYSQPLETAPVGGPPGQEPFLNAAIALETSLGPEALHALLATIENRLGRTRTQRWEARAIDLDLLLYGEEIVASERLRVPHPRMAFRRFVLAPAAEVAADMLHPEIGWTVGRLLEHLDSSAAYFALLGPPGSGKTALAQALAAEFGGRLLLDPLQSAQTSGAGDSPSQVFGREIQFLDRWRSLASEPFAAAASPPTFSDFYFDQCLAYARVALDDARFEEFCRHWDVARRDVVSPKILIALEFEPADEAMEQSASLDSASEQDARLRAELRRLARRQGIGPVLHLDHADFAVQFQEASAAVIASR